MKDRAAEWIRDALTSTGKSQKGLAVALGISQPQVSRLVAGKRRLQAAEIPLLESYFNLSFPQRSAPMPLVPVLSPPKPTRTILVRYVINSGVWREKGSSVVDATPVAASVDPRVADLDQYSCRIDGADMANLVGQYAVCVAYRELRLSPVDGDVVHIVKSQGGLEEHTLRKVIVSKGAVSLAHLTSSNDTIELSDDIEIHGLVVALQRPLRF